MRVLIVGIIVLAFAVAAVSTYLIKTFSTPEAIEEMEAAAEPIRTRVLVATRKLNRDDVLLTDAMRWQFWPDDGVNKAYIVAEKDDQEAAPIEEYENSIVRQDIEAGEPILASKVFKAGQASTMAGILEPGMRAVAIPVTPESGAAGFILPGDRVDILLVHNRAQEAIRQVTPETEQEDAAQGPLVVLAMTTETIMRNVEVLAVDAAIGQVEGNTVQARTVTVQLTPKEAELLTTARSMGQLSLALRSMASEEDPDAPRSYTTDVEVSPFLSNLEAAIAGEREQALNATIERLEAEKRVRESIAREQASEIESLTSAIETSSSQAPVAAPRATPKPEISVVKIYRGASAETESVSSGASASQAGTAEGETAETGQ